MRPLRLIPLISFGVFSLCALIALREHDAYQPAFRHDSVPPPLQRPKFERGDATLAGTVVDAQGAAIAHALVGLWQAKRLWWSNADERGRFQLSGLAAGASEISVVAPGFEANVVEVTIGGADVTLNMGERVPAAPEIAPVVWVDLAGQLRDVQLDEATGYEILFVPARPEDFRIGVVPRRTRVDRRGEFLVPRLAPARYRVSLLPPWAHGGRDPDLLTALDGDPVEFEHNADVGLPRTLELVPLAATIVGYVTQATRNTVNDLLRNEQVEGAQIRVRPAGDDQRLAWPPTTTASDGAYVVADLPAGDYIVQMLRGTEPQEQRVSVRAGQTLQVDFINQ